MDSEEITMLVSKEVAIMLGSCQRTACQLMADEMPSVRVGSTNHCSRIYAQRSEYLTRVRKRDFRPYLTAGRGDPITVVTGVGQREK